VTVLNILLANIILNNFVLYFVIYSLIAGPLLLSIISTTISTAKLIINYKNIDKESNLRIFNELIKDELGLKLFSNYCTKEFSLENLSLYIDIMEFNKEKDNDVKINMEKVIFLKYLSGKDSEMEVNLPSYVIDNIKNNMNNIINNKIKDDLYEELMKELINNLLGFYFLILRYIIKIHKHRFI
jgi:hypothetical protein